VGVILGGKSAHTLSHEKLHVVAAIFQNLGSHLSKEFGHAGLTKQAIDVNENRVRQWYDMVTQKPYSRANGRTAPRYFVGMFSSCSAQP